MAKKKRATVILKAEFNPRIKTYIYVVGIVFFVVTVVGIPLLPFWLIFGRLYINKYFDSLHCELTTHALHYKKGVLFHTERTIPLDKIQDLMFHEGPVLRYWQLSTLKVETAGQSGYGTADLSLTGIMDARQFRERVLDQRDEITNQQRNYADPDLTTQHSNNNHMLTLLGSIHETLQSIEKKLN